MAQIFASRSPEVTQRELDNMERARRIAAEGMVLLANDGALPLEGEDIKVAAFGAGVRRTVKGGTGSGDVNTRNVINVEEGLEAAGITVVSKAWLDRCDEEYRAKRQAYFERLAAKYTDGEVTANSAMFMNPFIEPPLPEIREEEMEPADAALFVITRNSGEGKDRRTLPGEYELYEEEKTAIAALAAHYDKLIVVLNVGGVMDTRFFRETPGVGAILLMSQPGNNGGYSLADVLTGKTDPSGRLTTTWADKYTDYPSAETFSHRNGNLDDEFYYEGIYVGYRYFDTFDVTPAYPFGFGLSYTEFSMEWGDARIKEETFKIAVKVTNIGARPGREVVQLYYSAPDEEGLEKPYQELGAYRKTPCLAPGESAELELEMPLRLMASYDEAGAAYVLSAGEYLIRLGRHSRDTRVAAVLTLDARCITEKLSNSFKGDMEFTQMSRRGHKAYADPEEAAQVGAAVHLAMPELSTRTAQYHDCPPALAIRPGNAIQIQDVRDGKATLDQFIAQLTPAQLADLCCGSSHKDSKAFSVIGNASRKAPGAAGDTTSDLMASHGVPNLVLADGPAGIRLVRWFVTDANDEPIPGLADSAMGDAEALRAMMGEVDPKAPADARTYYQYCTAIPIATLLAQTWDDAAIEAAGDIVGSEMELFGVNIWLAPAMNIHRNPLCGRNFEYYSEDPLISGKSAAADTRGVQRHKGCATCIKHYAMNNQEDNRSHTSAHCSERAIREIYLKGFEIAIKESQPHTLMTSYNLIHGRHTANDYELITKTARQEWGFEGFVMTDWGTTGKGRYSFEPDYKYGSASASLAIAAGNDMMMPGLATDVEEILDSLDKKEGEVPFPVTLAELQEAARNILRVIVKAML